MGRILNVLYKCSYNKNIEICSNKISIQDLVKLLKS